MVIQFRKHIFGDFQKYVWSNVREKSVSPVINNIYKLVKDTNDKIRPHRKPLATGGAIFIAVVVLVFIYSTLPWVKSCHQKLQWTPWGEVISKIIVPALSAIVTALGVIIAAIIALDRVRKQTTDNTEKRIAAEQEKTEKQIAAEQEKTREEIDVKRFRINKEIDVERFKINAERFKSANGQLADDNPKVVLGGVHALHNLARTFPKEYSQQVLEVLCSFIREETTKKEYQDRNRDNPSIVIQTIVDKLFREEEARKYYQEYWANLSRVFLRGVKLWHANLQVALLFDANLQGAHLQNANLQGANLNSANLRGANLPLAKLQGAFLTDADLQEADLSNAVLQGAWLNNADLPGAKLDGADLRGVQSQEDLLDYLKAIMEAMKEGLKMELSGIRLYGDNGEELTPKAEKIKWFRKKKAIVKPDLSAEEVREIFKDFREKY